MQSSSLTPLFQSLLLCFTKHWELMTVGAKEHRNESFMKCEINWLTFTENVDEPQHVDEVFR